MELKKIYIVISQTGSIVSKFIRIVTRDRYNHVSISLDKELKNMYSFGRVHTYNAFIGGFVKESVENGTFKRFVKNTVACIMELEVTSEKYDEIVKDLAEMYRHKGEYHYNYKGLFLAMFGKSRHKIHTFYCSEFLQNFLEKHGISEPRPDTKVIKPMDFLEMPNGKVIFEGRLRDFCRRKAAKYRISKFSKIKL
ncbi:MAG: hypothetical protein IKB51_01935 [Clostridia bacterium]|nr:hypothetical protein [Clostridia bacterium]